jgi:ketosteroid isomerase-like protein
MSQENVETMRTVYDAWQQGDLDTEFEYFHEDVEWRPPTDISAQSEVYRGENGVRRSLAEWIDMWDDYRFELGELLDLGDHVLAEGWQTGRGKLSGIEVSEAIYSLWTLRDSKIARQVMSRDRQYLLDMAGVAETAQP